VSVTISPPIRVFALLGVILATALALFLFIAGRSATTSGEIASPVTPSTRQVKTHAPATRTHAKPTHPAKPRTTHFQTRRSGFPTAVDRAFRSHRVVVLVVYMPGSSVDALVRKEARAGAISSGAGYVPVSAANGRVAGQLVAKTGVLPDPAVVVVERPGVVQATFGITDRETVAQAVAQAKR
jgi:hypothetical protein